MCRWACKRPQAASRSTPQRLTKGPLYTIPTPLYGLSSPKNAPLTQRLAGLSQRLAVRRAFAGQKSENRLGISCHFLRQGYASDVRSRQSFLTTATQRLVDVRYSQEGLPCCIAFVLQRVRGIHAYGLLGLIYGETMRRSRHTYLTNHRYEGVSSSAQSAPNVLPCDTKRPCIGSHGTDLTYRVRVPAPGLTR